MSPRCWQESRARFCTGRWVSETLASRVSRSRRRTSIARSGGTPNVTNETGTLVVSEVFGPTIQGEGPSLGRRAGFIRLGGCDLTCSWCDAAYTWNASRYDLRAELTRMPVTAMVERALVGDPEIVVITGGEPLLHQQQAGRLELLDQLGDADVRI